MRYAPWGILCGLIWIITAAGSPAGATETRCPDFPPVMSVALLTLYPDAKGAVPDPAAEQKNRELTAGVDTFLRSVEAALDAPQASPGTPAADCAYKNFTRWAGAGALTVDPKPFNRDGMIKRGEYLIGLNALALKFKAAGFKMDETVLSWLRGLNDRYADYYEHGTNRGNLYNWSGAGAALFAVLARDQKAIDHQDLVWHAAIQSIRPDGTIEGEMNRGQRALMYHLYSFSGVAILRSAREALGYKESPEAIAKLKLLTDTIGRTLCDPGLMAGPAQAPQEVPGDYAFRVPLGFAGDLLGDDWSRCGRPHADLSDPTTGGNSRHTANILKQIAASKGR